MTGERPVRFPMRLPRRWQLPLLIYGVTGGRAYVDVGETSLMARFGWYRVATSVSNVASLEVTGPYRWWRALGVRISLADRGLTFGSSTHGGVCIRFRQPVRFARIFRPPAMTVTVDDVAGLDRALRERIGREVEATAR